MTCHFSSCRSDRELLGPNNQYLPKIVSVFAEVGFVLSIIHFTYNLSTICPIYIWMMLKLCKGICLDLWSLPLVSISSKRLLSYFIFWHATVFNFSFHLYGGLSWCWMSWIFYSETGWERSHELWSSSCKCTSPPPGNHFVPIAVSMMSSLVFFNSYYFPLYFTNDPCLPAWKEGKRAHWSLTNLLLFCTSCLSGTHQIAVTLRLKNHMRICLVL